MASEKEVNVYLFSQLDALEDILAIAEAEQSAKTIECVEKWIERTKRKLYQNPPLGNEA